MSIIITSEDTISIDGVVHKVVVGRPFSTGYTDFAPRVLEVKDKETGGLIVEFGTYRLVELEGEVKQVKADSCNQFIVVPEENETT